jgi:hypothetical protein
VGHEPTRSAAPCPKRAPFGIVRSGLAFAHRSLGGPLSVAREKLQIVRGKLVEAWREFRAESGYFQVKVAIVAAYALIVVTTLVLVPKPPETYEVVVQQVSFGLSHRTIVDIKNLRLGDLEPARIVIDGVGKDFDGKPRPGPFEMQISILPEGQKLSVHTDKLKDSLKRAAPATIDVKRVQVYEDDDLVIDHDPNAPKKR